MSTLGHDHYCDLLAAELDRLVSVAWTTDPDLPVPTCGSWDTRALFHHLGAIHDWVARIVSTRSATRLSRTLAGYPIPADPARWPSWLAGGGAAVLGALRAADPDAAVWCWGPDRHVRWWARRMLHETGVHRMDAELAAGIEPAVDPAVAADGVEEFLINLRSAGRWAADVRSLAGTGETIGFSATDRADAWQVTLEPTGFSWAVGGAGAPDARVSGPAADLYLFVWGRRGPQHPTLSVDGDPALLHRWIAHTAL